jgi:hypothetical protein
LIKHEQNFPGFYWKWTLWYEQWYITKNISEEEDLFYTLITNHWNLWVLFTLKPWTGRN